MWLFGLSQVIFPDPLWAGRFVSVLFGATNLRLVYLISAKLFNSKVAFISSILYILCPIFLFYDRQALMESSLMTVSLFTFINLSQLTNRPSLKSTLLAFLTLGFGFWIKSSSLVFLVTVTAVISLYATINHRHLASYFSHLLLGLTLFFLVISPLFFQLGFISTWYRNSDYSLTLSQILQLPYQTWIANLQVNSLLWFLLLTPPIFISSIVGIVIFFRSNISQRDKLLAFFWLIFPLGLFFVSAKFSGYMFQRYSLPFLPLTLIFAAFFFSRLHKIFYLLLLIPAGISLLQIFNPSGYFKLVSHFTKYSYIEDYITGYATGYQVNAIMDYLKERSRSGSIMVGHELANFNPTAGVFVYSRKTPNLHPVYVGTLLPGFEKYNCVSTPQPLYLVSISDNLADLSRFLVRNTEITNSFSNEKNVIYTLKNDCPKEKTAPLPYLDR